MKELTNQTVQVFSDNNKMIILKWPDMAIYLTIENSKALIEGLQKAVEHEEKNHAEV